MSKTFWPHQEQAWQYAKDLDRIALFMEMRCGKTPVAIRWAQEKTANGVILVLGPVEVLDDWIDELTDAGETRIIHATMLSAKDREDVVTSARTWNSDKRLWVLFNYESIRSSKSTFLERVETWDVVIADESTKIRNPKAKTTKIVNNLGRRVPHRAILSGLPAPESVADYFSQMVFLHGHFQGHDNFWVWRENNFYQPFAGLKWKWEIKVKSLTAIRNEINRLAFRMTRKRAKIGGIKLRNRWVVEPTPEQIKATKSAMKDFDVNGHETMWATVRDVWLARIAGGYLPTPGPVDPETGEPTTVYTRISNKKIELLTDRLQTDLRGEPVVVWFRFNAELNDAYAALQAAGMRVRMITGVTPRMDRVSIRKAFARREFDVLLIQLRTGSYGLNLSVASTTIYFSNMYDLEIRAQTEDRTIHGTKKTPCHYIDIVTRGSIDVTAADALQRKWRSVRIFDSALAAEWAAYFKKEFGRG